MGTNRLFVLLHWYLVRYMSWSGLMLWDIFGSDPAPAPPPPNYAPLQAASDKAAELGLQLGQEQLAETRRQYDINRGVSNRVADSQLALMDQTKAQGDDYFNYMKSRQRPVEDSLNAESMLDTTGPEAASRDAIMARINQNAAQDEAERGLITGGDRGIYDARRGDIDWGVGNASADARAGQTRNANAMVRQGLRYGYSPAKMAAMAGQMATTNASQEAGAANAARRAGIDQARGLMGQSYQLRNATAANQVAGMTNQRGMGIQDKATNWARKMDVAGLYRGLPGASQGAYGLSTNAGNSAVGNTMQPGNALLMGMGQGAGMQQAGAGQQIGGLGQVLNAQNSYNSMLAQTNAANAQADASGMAGLGQLAGTIGAAGIKAGWFSDRRLKEHVVAVGVDERTELPLYEFSYKGVPGKRFRGVMADEVEEKFPSAVLRDNSGFAVVDYGQLGIEMVRV